MMKKLLWAAIVCLSFGNSLAYAKSYDKTSYYVAYNSEDKTQYALVLPSVQKIYTHKAGDITHLKQIDGQFFSFPTYDNGELCFSELLSGTTGDNGASTMAGKCYDVNFFYTQKERTKDGTVFLLYYAPGEKLYEGLAGKADTFKVVTDKNGLYPANSLTGEDYTEFRFDTESGFVFLDEGGTGGETNTPNHRVKKTGQTKSYDENGDEVTDGSLKDDGYYKKGVDPIYIRDDDKEIVADHITGLMWQDDIGVKSYKPWLSRLNYDKCHGENGQTQDISKCEDVSGDTAVSYCASLSLGGYSDWRLPAQKDLLGILNYSKSNKMIDDAFQQISTSGQYWSSTQFDEDTAYLVKFKEGIGTAWVKKDNRNVRCIRGMAAIPDITRDSEKEVVIDAITHLVWQDNNETNIVRQVWRDAIGYCEVLTLGGYSDWRMPNINELYTIVTWDSKNPAISPVFQNTSNNRYWSSTVDAVLPGLVWYVDFGNANSLWRNHRSDNWDPERPYIRCVRDKD